MLLHCRPLRLDDGEHDRVAVAAVRQALVVAQYAVLFRAEPRDGRSGGVVVPVRAKLHGNGLELFKGVGQEQELAFGVDGGALPRAGVPGVPISRRWLCSSTLK